MSNDLRIAITGDSSNLARALAAAVAELKTASALINKHNSGIASDSEKTGRRVKNAWFDAEKGMLDFQKTSHLVADAVSTKRGGPINSLTRGLGNIIRASGDVGTAMQKAFAKVLPAANDAKAAGGVFEKLGLTTSQLLPVLGGLIGVVTTLGVALVALPATVGIVIFAFTALLDTATILGAGLLALAAPVAVVTGLLGGLGAAFAYVAAQSIKNSASQQQVHDNLLKLHVAQQTYNQDVQKYGKSATETENALLALHTAQDAYQQSQVGVALNLQGLKDKFQSLVGTLAQRFRPALIQLGHDAGTALSYLEKVAKLPIGQAFRSLSTTGIKGIADFVRQVGSLLAKPFRLAIRFGFGAGEKTLSAQAKSIYNELTAFLTGPGGALNPVVAWFHRQDLTETGLRWAAEIKHGIVGLWEHDKAFHDAIVTVLEDAAHAAGQAFVKVLKWEISSIWGWLKSSGTAGVLAFVAGAIIALGPLIAIIRSIGVAWGVLDAALQIGVGTLAEAALGSDAWTAAMVEQAAAAQAAAVANSENAAAIAEAAAAAAGATVNEQALSVAMAEQGAAAGGAGAATVAGEGAAAGGVGSAAAGVGVGGAAGAEAVGVGLGLSAAEIIAPIALLAAEVYFGSQAPPDTTQQRLRQTAPLPPGTPSGGVSGGAHGAAAAAVAAMMRPSVLQAQAADISKAMDTVNGALQVAAEQFGIAAKGIKLSAVDIANVERVLAASRTPSGQRFAVHESQLAGRALAPNEVSTLLTLRTDHPGIASAINEFLKLTHRVTSPLVANILVHHEKAALAIAAYIAETHKIPTAHQLKVLDNIPGVAIPRVAKYIAKTGQIPKTKTLNIIIAGAEKAQKALDKLRAKIVQRELTDHHIQIHANTDPVLQQLENLKGHATKLFAKADFANSGAAITGGIAAGINSNAKQITTALTTAMQNAVTAAQAYASAHPIIVQTQVTSSGTHPHREAGGAVQAGVAYTVGERGPETYVPGAAGAILPANETAKLAAALPGYGMAPRTAAPRPASDAHHHKDIATRLIHKIWEWAGPKFWPGFQMPPTRWSTNTGTEAGLGWNGPHRHVLLNEAVKVWLDPQYGKSKKYHITADSDVELLLHEWAHAFQTNATMSKQWLREGGAEAFAIGTSAGAEKAIGFIPFVEPVRYSVYTDYLRRVLRDRDAMWVIHDQFVHRGVHSLKAREKLVHKYEHHFDSQRDKHRHPKKHPGDGGGIDFNLEPGSQGGPDSGAMPYWPWMHGYGGNAWAGQVSLVGEHGPELRYETSNARYVPAQDTARMAGGGETHLHFHFPNALIVDAKAADQAARLIKPSLDRLAGRRV